MRLSSFRFRLAAGVLTFFAISAAHGEEMQMPMSASMPMPQENASAPAMPANMDMGGDQMPGALGPYGMTRDASGTSWQPDSSPMQGIHWHAGDWNVMADGQANTIYDNQGGPRGADKTFSSSMGMLMAQRAVGENGTLGLRSMMSLDPLMGANGYPLLFATGETANGHSPLVDRQHPHDLFMEMSGTYSYRLSENAAVFGYAGLPGEPALGPTSFMQRLSAADNPEAPITHHWLDSTHITYGVVTGGYVYGPWKIEASSFKGREPDQYRSDIEEPKLDSVSSRLTFNPAPNWSLQTSWGYLKSPEQLMPAVNENRVTASASYNLPFDDNNWATTFAWGRKIEDPGRTLDGFLLESEVVLHDTHTFFARAEKVDEDELFDGTPLNGQIVNVSELTLGYVRDFHVMDHVKVGLGGLVTRYDYPNSINTIYGDEPTSFMLFMRLKTI